MGHAPINASAYRLGTSRLLKSHNSPCSNGNSLCSNGNGSSIAPHHRHQRPILSLLKWRHLGDTYLSR